MEVLKLTNVSKVFNKGMPNCVNALKDINISINQGEFSAITGVSGSGKSTLLNIIGMIDTPTSGTYEFADSKVEFDNDDKLNKIRCDNLGFIYQNFNLLPVLTVAENVQIAMVKHNYNNKQLKELTYNILTSVGVADKYDKFPNELSGGQK